VLCGCAAVTWVGQEGRPAISSHSKKYWKRRLAHCRQSLTQNGFEAFCAENVDQARQVVADAVLPRIQFESVSWGDSLTLYATGILEMVRQVPGVRVIDPFEIGVPRNEIIERRRQALLSDLFFSGTNAITESGVLVNLDMIGNRIGGISFGPHCVVVVAGRNKVVGSTADAMHRIRHTAAPANAIRHENLRTPCRKTSLCTNCKSPDRICNTWSVIEHSIPAGRIKVVLINEDCGL
jgi:hypothetical protein